MSQLFRIQRKEEAHTVSHIIRREPVAIVVSADRRDSAMPNQIQGLTYETIHSRDVVRIGTRPIAKLTNPEAITSVNAEVIPVMVTRGQRPSSRSVSCSQRHRSKRMSCMDRLRLPVRVLARLILQAVRSTWRCRASPPTWFPTVCTSPMHL